MCLYDWVARCERTKLPKKQKSNSREKDEDDGHDVTDGGSPIDKCPSSHPSFRDSRTTSNVFPLLSEHPLATTHGTRCCPVGKEKVPNFIGPTLPRCDQGDREFYCSVMLTLFKPWRSGLELKTQEQSWDDAFSTHSFSAKHKDIMRNLNIRYECLDARDDFHAQLNKGDIDITVSWDDPDVRAMQDIDEMTSGDNLNVVQPKDDFNVEHHVHDLSNELGKCKKAQTHLMSEMRATLQDLGWTENIPELLNQVVHVRRPPPEVQRNGAAWKTVVAQKRTEVLQLHSQNMPEHSKSMTSHGTANNQFVPDNVRVVKKSYLSSRFVSKEWQATIEDIFTHFSLNQEQGRAFRIVVNHACDQDSEQLKMYIGGMVGTGKSQVLHALSEFFRREKNYIAC